MKPTVHNRTWIKTHLVIACVLSSLIAFPAVAVTQTTEVSFQDSQPLSLSQRTMQQSQSPGSKAESTPLDPRLSHRAVPKEVVKVLFDPVTEQLTLIGSPEDIAIVKRAILDVEQKLQEQRDNEMLRIKLKFQLAETVSSVLNQSMGIESKPDSRLKITPLHFPEAILLTGPPSAVKRAQEIISKIDSHDYYSGTDEHNQRRQMQPRSAKTGINNDDHAP